MKSVKFEKIATIVTKDELAFLKGGGPKPADHSTDASGDTYFAATDAYSSDTGRYCQYDCPKSGPGGGV